MSIGNFLESLTQAVLVGTMLVGELGVLGRGGCSGWRAQVEQQAGHSHRLLRRNPYYTWFPLHPPLRDVDRIITCFDICASCIITITIIIISVIIIVIIIIIITITHYSYYYYYYYYHHFHYYYYYYYYHNYHYTWFNGTCYTIKEHDLSIVMTYGRRRLFCIDSVYRIPLASQSPCWFGASKPEG